MVIIKKITPPPQSYQQHKVAKGIDDIAAKGIKKNWTGVVVILKGEPKQGW